MTKIDKNSAPERKFANVEVKADESGLFEGYASRFGEIDSGGDTVVKGAFSNTLKRSGRVKMLWQHNPNEPIGVWDEIKEDDTGLFVRGRILESVSKGAEVLTLVRAGAVDGLSIGYRTVKSSRGANGERILQELELWETSIVTFPMQETAGITAFKAMKSFEEGHTALLKRLVEERLCEAGFSNTEAKAASSAAVGKLKDMREAGSGLNELAQIMRQFQIGQGV